MSDSGGRPKTRGDCKGGPRPCPFVSCRHNLLVEITDVGTISLDRGDNLYVRGRLFPAEQAAFEDRAIDKLERMTDSCALDVADRGNHTLDEIAVHLGFVSRQRIQQIEERAMAKLRSKRAAADLDE